MSHQKAVVGESIQLPSNADLLLIVNVVGFMTFRVCLWKRRKQEPPPERCKRIAITTSNLTNVKTRLFKDAVVPGSIINNNII